MNPNLKGAVSLDDIFQRNLSQMPPFLQKQISRVAEVLKSEPDFPDNLVKLFEGTGIVVENIAPLSMDVSRRLVGIKFNPQSLLAENLYSETKPNENREVFRDLTGCFGGCLPLGTKSIGLLSIDIGAGNTDIALQADDLTRRIIICATRDGEITMYANAYPDGDKRNQDMMRYRLVVF